MLLTDLKNTAKTKKVYVYFDMDGVLVEYLLDKNKTRYLSGTNFYTNNRPIHYTLNVAKDLAETNNIEVCILSNCPLHEQIEQKMGWLKKNAPFIKPENINIICYEDISFKKEDKHMLKAKILEEKIKNGNYCVLIEDDLRNISEVNKYLNAEVAYHLSNIIE